MGKYIISLFEEDFKEDSQQVDSCKELVNDYCDHDCDFCDCDMAGDW